VGEGGGHVDDPGTVGAKRDRRPVVGPETEQAFTVDGDDAGRGPDLDRRVDGQGRDRSNADRFDQARPDGRPDGGHGRVTQGDGQATGLPPTDRM